MTTIRALANTALVRAIAPGLRAVIDDMLSRGYTPADVRRIVRISVRKSAVRDRQAGQLTVDAVEAYLETLEER